MVSPFCIIPPRHGGATRSYNLAKALANSFEVVLLSDERALYEPADVEPGAPAGAQFSAIYLVGERGAEPFGQEKNRAARIRSHSHPRLKTELRRLIETYSPCAVLIENMELGDLINIETRSSPAFILSLHDVLLQPNDPLQAGADAFELGLIDRFDGRVVCSREDAALLGNRASCVVDNGYDFTNRHAYQPSKGTQRIVFVGPFRAAINFEGICEFLKRSYPSVRAAVPTVSITIVGGLGARDHVAGHPLFNHPSINVVDSVMDMGELLVSGAVTICPLLELRGSSLKVVESLAAGRVCVCTQIAARGWADKGFGALVIVPDLASFAAPLIKLLTDEPYRLACETADLEAVMAFSWEPIGRTFADYIQLVVANKSRQNRPLTSKGRP
jgi:glycosyltransferase involved in cell wall biosynthesis